MNPINPLKIITEKSFFTLFFIVMSIVYIPIEGEAISMLKVFILALSSSYLIIGFKLSKALILCALYWFSCLFFAQLHIYSFRWGTILYLGFFLIGFSAYVNAVYAGAFNREYFLKLLKGLIYAYFIALIIQQFYSVILGGGRMLILNYTGVEGKPNMLSLEVSHAARIIAAFMLCIVRLYELDYGRKLSIKEIYECDKWLFLIFLYIMITIGSGTAIIALAILSLYFLSARNAIIVFVAFIICYSLTDFIDYEPLHRAKVTFEASLTGDKNRIGRADGSAAHRVIPLLNTFLHLDLTSTSIWIGKGIDTSYNTDLFLRTKYVGTLADYGLISYALSLLIFFTICIRSVFSVETLFFVFICLMNMSNIAFYWAIYMSFATVHYFQKEENV